MIKTFGACVAPIMAAVGRAPRARAWASTDRSPLMGYPTYSGATCGPEGHANVGQPYYSEAVGDGPYQLDVPVQVTRIADFPVEHRSIVLDVAAHQFDGTPVESHGIYRPTGFSKEQGQVATGIAELCLREYRDLEDLDFRIEGVKPMRCLDYPGRTDGAGLCGPTRFWPPSALEEGS